MNLVFPKPPTDFGTGSMFDQIATRYDFINRALALNLDTGWRKVMVKDVIRSGLEHNFLPSNNNGDKKIPFRVLDLATGTADVSILLAKEYRAVTADDNEQPPQLEILGIDPSENMIQVGRKKVENQGLEDEIMLEIGDARDLKGLKDSSFNAVTMSFGIRNVPEKKKVLCEMHRVLKMEVSADGGEGDVGKLAILEFTEPTYSEGGVMGLAARIFIRFVVPVIGAVLSGAPREYMHLQNSIKEFPPPKEFVALMEGVKCGDKGRGTFQVDEVKYLNFGSVVLYLASPIIS
eukprot:CAMPEP_0198270206 /NCGR_PEP_ID=MMETSP1447-20131203/44154_1 /TAXON_ID=420782 /ORGANISM="Chaetoceros dichaeta, Strain CCMP1751" /LENGTH=290 /DNA_ID=CAMNT_0043962119 /DNA_START=52 /DNA_END=924 /DNA_ORIENTATION=-